MAWRIDRDYISDGDRPSAVGTRQGQPEGDTFSFRLRDDDGEVYYHGVADDRHEDDEDGGLYLALKWGEWYAGATDLQVRADEALDHGLTSRDYLAAARLGPRDWVSIYG
jgi:hypothetical protein